MKLKALLVASLLPFAAQVSALELLNVSYDPTRELYKEFNPEFAKHWKETTGETITVATSHGGSGRQARSVIDGLRADVVTLAMASDIDAIVDNAKSIPKDWQARLPHNSSPYTSTIVLLVRAGNPKNIKDWDDLVRDDVKVITPNPKTSGGARWNYLAAYAYALKHNNNDDAKARAFVGTLYKNVPVLDTAARGALTTFIQRGIGDVFISWENEGFLALNEFGKEKFEVIYPSLSILAEPTVTVVDANVDRKKTRKQAEAYLQFLYSPIGQDIAAKHYYRPAVPEFAAKHKARFPELELVTIEDFGGWRKVQPEHFGDGGVFDQIYQP